MATTAYLAQQIAKQQAALAKQAAASTPAKTTTTTTTVDPRIATIKALLATSGPMGGAPGSNTNSPVTQNINGTSVTFYPTQQGWVQTQIPGAQGYVTTTQLPALQQAQTTVVQQAQQATAQKAAAAQQAQQAQQAAAQQAAAQKAAADAAAAQKAQQAAQQAATAKQTQINDLVNQYSSATTPAQVDNITGQLSKLGYTPSNQMIANAKAGAVQAQTTDFDNQLTSAKTTADVNAIVAQAKSAGIAIDPTQANTRISLTNSLNNVTQQSNIDNIVAQAKAQGITLDQSAVDAANAKFTLPSNQYTNASTIDPKVLSDYGIKPAIVNGQQVIQTTNPNALGYVNPSDLQKYQQLTQQTQATAQAQANFTLPDASTVGRGQTVTSPDGQSSYQAVPADPVTGAPAQWYKISSDGQSYTAVDTKGQAVSNAPAIPRTDYYNQFDTATQDIQSKQYNDYVASIPTTTVGSHTYQTQDPNVANYISPKDLAYTQQQYQQQQQNYQQLVDQAKAVNPADFKDTGDTMIDPNTGTVYQSKYPDMPNYVAGGQQWSQLEQQLGQHSGYSTSSFQQYQTTNETKRVDNAMTSYQQQYDNRASAYSGAPAEPVRTADKLPTIGADSHPMVAADTGIKYYPTADGWKQASDPNAANYQAANEIKMQMPTAPSFNASTSTTGAYEQQIQGPDGTIYFPKWANPNTGEAGGWAQSSNPNAPGYMDQASLTQLVNSENQASYHNDTTTNTDPLTGSKVQTTNPYLPGYISPDTLNAHTSQYQQQQTADNSPFGIDDLGKAIDSFVNKTVGWDTIATIAGSMVGGPLGAALANATAHAVQGQSPGDILKGAALAFAMSYGTEALANELSPAIQEATTTAVDNGTLSPDTLSQASNDLSSSGYADQVAPEVVQQYAPSEAVAPTGEVSPTPVAPEATTSPVDISTPQATPVAPEATPITTQPSVYDNAIDYGAPQPVQPQAPTDLTSTGFSDSAPGTIYTNQVTGAQEIVLDSGKTVNLADYNAAAQSGNPVSIDGMMQTGGTGVPGAGAYQVDIGGAPYLQGSAPQGWQAPDGMRLATPDEATALLDAGGKATTLPDGSMAWVVPENTLPDVVVTATREGLATPEMIIGGAAVAGGALALSMGGGGAAGAGGAGAVATPVAPPGPVEATPIPPETTPAPTPTTTPAPVAETPVVPPTQTPAPVSPGEAAGGTVAGGTTAGTGGAGTSTLPPVTDVTPTPVTPTTPVPPPEVPPGSVPVTDVTPTPVETVPGTNVPVEQPPAPVTESGPPQTVTTAGEAAAAGYDAQTIAKWVAAGLIANSLLNPTVPSIPNDTYSPLPPTQWGATHPLAQGGVNPGYFTNPTPFYQTTSPVQSKYYWGAHPYIQSKDQFGQVNQVPNAPTTPWGLQQQRGAFDVNNFITHNLGLELSNFQQPYPLPQQSPAVAPVIPQGQPISPIFTAQNLQQYLPPTGQG